MDGIELTLRSLRRSQVVLVVLALVLLGVSSTAFEGPDYAAAVDELELAQELLRNTPFPDLCRGAAQRTFSEQWTALAQRDFADAAAPYRTSFTAHCFVPSGAVTVADVRALLDNGIAVVVPVPADRSLTPILETRNGWGRPDEILVLWDRDVSERWRDGVALAPLSRARMRAFAEGRDSLDVLFLYTGTRGPSASGLDTSTPDGVIQAAPGRVSARLPGVVVERRLFAGAIIEQAPRWGELVGSPDDALQALPGVQVVFEEVADLPLPEAIEHVRSLARERRAGLDVLGRRVPTAHFAWLAPLLLAALLLDILIGMGHLRRIVSEEPEAVHRFRWLPLLSDAMAIVIAHASLLALPALAVAVFVYQLSGMDSGAAVRALVVSAVAVALAVRIVTLLPGLRRVLDEAAPEPATASAPEAEVRS